MKKIMLFLFLAFLTFLTGCDAAPAGYPAGQAVPQATLAAGQVQLMDLAARSTQIVLDLRAAEATDTFFSRATQSAQAWQATATRQAADAQATTIAQIEATQAAQTTATAQVMATQTAWPMTATPLAATQAAIILQAVETERKAYWDQFVIPLRVILPTVLFTVVLVLLIVGGVAIYRRMAPVWEMRSRTIFTPSGEILNIIPRDSQVNILLPGRSFGPVLENRPEGVRLEGLPGDPQLQDRTTARHQAAILARALPRAQANAVKHLAMAPKEATQPPALPPVRVEIVPPQQLRPWIDEVIPQLQEHSEEES